MSKLMDNLNAIYREVSLLEDIEQDTLKLFSESIDEVGRLEDTAEYNQNENVRLRLELYGPKSTKGTGTAGGGT